MHGRSFAYAGAVTDRIPVSLSEADIAAVRSWVIHEDEAVIAFNKPATVILGKAMQARRFRKIFLAWSRQPPSPRPEP